MNDPFDLKPHIGTVQDYPIDGITFRDITIVKTLERLCSGMYALCRIQSQRHAVLKAAALFLQVRSRAT